MFWKPLLQNVNPCLKFKYKHISLPHLHHPAHFKSNDSHFRISSLPSLSDSDMFPGEHLFDLWQRDIPQCSSSWDNSHVNELNKLKSFFF